MSGKLKKVICMMCISMLFLNGCGISDAITAETKAMVESQTDKALELYADIEKVVEANHLEADKEFTDMKKQLTDMATEVKGKLAQAKEEDAKLALQEIDGIIDNLTKVKNYVDKTVSDAK